ncbi:MAG TPA: hypothetical protein VHU40_15780 [Polyangia bacterium]|jgi:hypothetical protein|nr:hypothetical protein [Polyangia bacterium]
MTTTRSRLASATFLALAAVSLPALAADDDDAPASVAAKAEPAAEGVGKDPNVDRGFILPTAMTQPQGSATYNNYELLLHGATYGITDHLQTSVTVLAPIVKDMPFYGVAALKWRLADAGAFHFAVQGSAGLAHVFSSGGSSSDTAYTVGAGAFASACLREDCTSLLSASVTYQRAFTANNGTNLLVYGGSLVHGVGQHVSLIGELASLAASNTLSDSGSFDQASGALVGYGVRLHTSSFASDIGFLKPVGTSGDDFLLGLPFVSVSYRWQ